jgi:hypothetical protein
MGALSLVQSDTQTQNDKKTRSPHFFLSKIQGATGCFCLFTALLPGANYETPAPLSTGILIFFRAAFSAKKPMPNAGFQLNPNSEVAGGVNADEAPSECARPRAQQLASFKPLNIFQPPAHPTLLRPRRPHSASAEIQLRNSG